MLADVQDESPGKEAGPRIGRRDFARLTLAMSTAIATGCAATRTTSATSEAAVGEALPARPYPARPGSGFPRSAAYFLAHDNLPTPNQFAQYDVVVIDNEWFGRLGPGFFADLRNHNPHVAVLAYVNVVDFPTSLGERANWANRYALWQYQSASQSVFPREWLATTASGQLVREWPNTWMTNLTDAAPMIDGRTFAQYAADWVVDQVWSAGVWDGICLDVWGDRVWSADHNAWDYRLDGTDTPDTEIYGLGNPWERSVNDAELRLRARMPSAVVVANGTRTLRDGQLNGRIWESFLDGSKGVERIGDLQTYLNESAGPGLRQPPYAITINSRGAPIGSAEEYRRARYHLTATLLQDGYWAPVGNSNYSELSYYDELDGGGLGGDYLGLPYISNPNFDRLNAPFADGLGVVADGVYRRDFDHGVVLHNSGSTSQTITFKEPMRLLAGKQAPDVNTGQVVESLTLAGGDGRILVRA